MRFFNTLDQPTREALDRKTIQAQAQVPPLTKAEAIAQAEIAAGTNIVKDPITGEPVVVPKPLEVPKVATVKTQVYRYRVQVNTTLHAAEFYKSEGYSRVRLTLGSADDVYVGTTKVSSANGSRLVQSVPFVILLSPGDRLYIGGVAAAPVDVVIHGIPWLEVLSQASFSVK